MTRDGKIRRLEVAQVQRYRVEVVAREIGADDTTYRGLVIGLAWEHGSRPRQKLVMYDDRAGLVIIGLTLIRGVTYTVKAAPDRVPDPVPLGPVESTG